jgi:hypothetical protein
MMASPGGGQPLACTDHGLGGPWAPLGVATWRTFNSAAAARADMPANSARTDAMAFARATASTRRVSLISGSRGPPSLTVVVGPRLL